MKSERFIEQFLSIFVAVGPIGRHVDEAAEKVARDLAETVTRSLTKSVAVEPLFCVTDPEIEGPIPTVELTADSGLMEEVKDAKGIEWTAAEFSMYSQNPLSDIQINRAVAMVRKAYADAIQSSEYPWQTFQVVSIKTQVVTRLTETKNVEVS
ncbi:hypothetical protein LC612_39105 [Nostoc sp. CHAB 5834]|nr:hypothetical protein [Nostoc sp. CHAB 5834]